MAWPHTHEDMLALLAEPLHPYASPRFNYRYRRWYWLPPWWEGDPEESPLAGEVLGREWEQARDTLERMRERLDCGHGRHPGIGCPQCRERVSKLVLG